MEDVMGKEGGSLSVVGETPGRPEESWPAPTEVPIRFFVLDNESSFSIQYGQLEMSHVSDCWRMYFCLSIMS